MSRKSRRNRARTEQRTRAAAQSSRSVPTPRPIRRHDGDLFADGALANLVTGAGTSADPLTQWKIKASNDGPPSKLDVDRLVQKEWGCEKFVSELPEESTRKGVDIKVAMEDDSTEDADDVAQQIQDRLEELKALEHIRQALKWERQYGGAALIPWMNDGQDPALPVRYDERGVAMNVQAIRRLQVVSRHRLNEPLVSDVTQDPTDMNYGMPEVWRLISDGVQQDALRIHYSRMHVWQGWKAGERDYPYQWGDSVLERFTDSWSQYLHALRHAIGIAQRLNETRLPVPGLTELLSGPSEFVEKYRKYIGEVALLRSVHRIMPFDPGPNGEGQPSDPSLNLSGAEALVKMAREDVAGAAGMSAQRFFGLAHEGMSDNDETGMQRDEAAIKAYQVGKLVPPLNMLIGLIIAEQGIQGVRTWQVVPRPLREETAKDRSQRRLNEAQEAQAYVTTQALEPLEIRETLASDPEGRWQINEEQTEFMRREAELLRSAETSTARPEDLPAGVQMERALQAIEKAAAGSISRESAVAFLQQMLKKSPEEAEEMLGPADFEPRPEASGPVPPQLQAAAGGDEPDPSGEDDDDDDDAA